LDRCRLIGRTYLCEHGNVVFETDPKDKSKRHGCVYHLFNQHEHLIQDVCPVHVITPSEAIVDISGSEFILISTESNKGTVSCPGQDQEDFSARPVTRIRLAPGCAARAGNSRAMATRDVRVELLPRSYGWEGDIHQLVSHIDLTLYRQLVEQAVNVSTVPTEVSDIQDWIQQKKMWAAGPHISIPGLAAATIFALITLAVGSFLVHRWWTKRHLAKTRGAMPSPDSVITSPVNVNIEMRNLAEPMNDLDEAEQPILRRAGAGRRVVFRQDDSMPSMRNPTDSWRDNGIHNASADHTYQSVRFSQVPTSTLNRDIAPPDVTSTSAHVTSPSSAPSMSFLAPRPSTEATSATETAPPTAARVQSLPTNRAPPPTGETTQSLPPGPYWECNQSLLEDQVYMINKTGLRTNSQ
jgi:hypothetical protein